MFFFISHLLLERSSLWIFNTEDKVPVFSLNLTVSLTRLPGDPHGRWRCGQGLTGESHCVVICFKPDEIGMTQFCLILYLFVDISNIWFLLSFLFAITILISPSIVDVLFMLWVKDIVIHTQHFFLSPSYFQQSGESWLTGFCDLCIFLSSFLSSALLSC